jgi:GTP cyclohydrolase IA
MVDWVLQENKIEKIIQILLAEGLALDFESEHLKDTPKRVAKFWREFLDYQPGNLDTTFDMLQIDQMVIVKDIPFYSLCAHHLLPFHGKITIGYIPKDKIIGLSKIARVVQKYAHSLQTQEQLTQNIADELCILLPDCLGVAIVSHAVHTCMVMRGIKSEGKMINSVMYGAFRDEPETRQEFFNLINYG